MWLEVGGERGQYCHVSTSVIICHHVHTCHHVTHSHQVDMFPEAVESEQTGALRVILKWFHNDLAQTKKYKGLIEVRSLGLVTDSNC